MKTWLTRTAQNKIAGPFTSEEVCDQVMRGKIRAQDEICQANRYWFYLHEAEELDRFLKITLPAKIARSGEDLTHTNIEDESTDTDVGTGESELESEAEEVEESESEPKPGLETEREPLKFPANSQEVPTNFASELFSSASAPFKGDQDGNTRLVNPTAELKFVEDPQKAFGHQSSADPATLDVIRHVQDVSGLVGSEPSLEMRRQKPTELEAPSYLRGLVWFLGLIAIVIVVLVLRFLEKSA